MTSSYSIRQKSLAWAVHLFTATGVLCAGLALLAILKGSPILCFFWLAVSLVVDGIDGTLARKVDIKNRLPEVDGSALDLIIDYLTYVFIPVLFMYNYISFPPNLLLLSLAVILVSSLYCFSNIGMKSEDYYFVGFPATWNIVAFYLYLLHLSPWVNFLVVVVLSGLTFTKLKFIHPFRVEHLRWLNLLMSSLCLLSGLAILLNEDLVKDYFGVGGLWIISSLYLLIISLWRSCQDYKRPKFII